MQKDTLLSVNVHSLTFLLMAESAAFRGQSVIVEAKLNSTLSTKDKVAETEICPLHFS